MAVAITCGYGGYLLPLLAAHSSFCWCNQKQRAVKPFDSQRFECGMIIGYFCMVINQQFPSWSGLKPINTVYFPFPTSGPIWKAWQTVHGLGIRCAESTLCRANREQSRLCNSLKVAWFTESPTYQVLKLQSGTLVLKIIHIYDPYNFQSMILPSMCIVMSDLLCVPFRCSAYEYWHKQKGLLCVERIGARCVLSRPFNRHVNSILSDIGILFSC